MTRVQYRNNPARPFNNLMDDLFGQMPSFFNESRTAGGFQPFPAVNVKEIEEGYELLVVAPGFEKEQFVIQLDGNLLTIAGAVTKVGEENGKSLRQEFELKPFKRSFNLDKNVDAEGICAKYVNGVLTVNLPRKKDVKEGKKQITIA